MDLSQHVQKKWNNRSPMKNSQHRDINSSTLKKPFTAGYTNSKICPAFHVCLFRKHDYGARNGATTRNSEQKQVNLQQSELSLALGGIQMNQAGLLSSYNSTGIMVVLFF